MRGYMKLCCIAMMTVSVTACSDEGKEEKPAGNKPASQVLARVNGSEVTVLQFNELLKKQKSTDDQVKQKVLDALIDQTLLIEKAEELGLDRSPEVVIAIESAKNQILAQAASQQLVGRPATPSAEAVKAYYDENGFMFQDRRVMTLGVFSVTTGQLPEAVDKALESSSSTRQTEKLLKDSDIEYTLSTIQRTPEKMPRPVAVQLSSLKPGDILKFPPQAGKQVLMQIVEVQPAPISESKADGAIRKFLMTQAAKKALVSQLEKLKAQSEIEVFKVFAEPSATAPETAPVSADTTDTEAETGVSDFIKEGVKGL